MPRYCAVKVCRNRGGAASRHDNRRISFYPFPLQDKARLQKWVDNMKREDWTPSRHQYLCSEHFTEDCFDVRWGIRYLKNTSIPTLFPSAENDGEKKVTTIQRSPKGKASSPDSEPDTTGCILSSAPKNLQSTTADGPIAELTEVILELPLLSDTVTSCLSSHSEMQTAACEIAGESGLPTASCLALPPCSEAGCEARADSTVTVLCCEPLGPFSDGGAVDVPSLQAALGHAFSFVPIETIKDKPTECFLEERGPVDGEHISLYEHSYCRPDTNKDQLWKKILSLHAKILELDHREETTVAKIRELENEITLLKRDGAVFKEKQKVLEDFISSVMI
ncbi:THAP domain-containing protein 5 [Salarias fasciatus]|uniref:THAP domain-containing protein 5 n=1 Tax=Salarias fasciatus TaxID=181472 RepID=A0A672JB39_SALFA|nr:THAP domain-containing protein 5 [Salarias fasciatus]